MISYLVLIFSSYLTETIYNSMMTSQRFGSSTQLYFSAMLISHFQLISFASYTSEGFDIMISLVSSFSLFLFFTSYHGLFCYFAELYNLQTKNCKEANMAFVNGFIVSLLVFNTVFNKRS